MSDWLSKLRNSEEMLCGLTDRIEVKAIAFGKTGNNYMATEMYEWLDAIDKIRAQISEAIEEKLSDGFRSAQQNSVNLLNGVLAGIDIGENK